MFCIVYPLRDSGSWNSVHAIIERGPLQGCLYFGPVEKGLRERFGRRAQIARLRALSDPTRAIAHDLHWARTLVVRDGGVLITGTELHPRGLKSSPVKVAQSWWCMFDVERAYTAMLKMNVRSATGFHPNDD